MEKKKAPLEIQKQTVWCCLLSVILSDHIIRSFNVFEFSKVMQNFCGSTVSQQFTKHRALEAPQHLEPLVATRCWDCAIALYLYMRLSQYSNDGGDGSFLLISTHLLAQILVCPFLALHSYTSKLLVVGRVQHFTSKTTSSALATSRRKAARGSCSWQSGNPPTAAWREHQQQHFDFGPSGGGRLSIPGHIRW